MLVILVFVFLPTIVTAVLYVYMNSNIRNYKRLPGFKPQYFSIPQEELKYSFGKPVLRDLLKLATFGSFFLFFFLMFPSFIVLLVEVIILIFLGSYFQSRANERLVELCNRYDIPIK